MGERGAKWAVVRKCDEMRCPCICQPNAIQHGWSRKRLLGIWPMLLALARKYYSYCYSVPVLLNFCYLTYIRPALSSQSQHTHTHTHTHCREIHHKSITFRSQPTCQRSTLQLVNKEKESLHPVRPSCLFNLLSITGYTTPHAFVQPPRNHGSTTIPQTEQHPAPTDLRVRFNDHRFPGKCSKP